MIFGLGTPKILKTAVHTISANIFLEYSWNIPFGHFYTHFTDQLTVSNKQLYIQSERVASTLNSFIPLIFVNKLHIFAFNNNIESLLSDIKWDSTQHKPNPRIQAQLSDKVNNMILTILQKHNSTDL